MDRPSSFRCNPAFDRAGCGVVCDLNLWLPVVKWLLAILRFFVSIVAWFTILINLYTH